MYISLKRSGVGEGVSVGLKVIKGLKVGVRVGAEVGVCEGVGVYLSMLIPGSGKGRISSAGLAQPDRQKSMTAKRKKITLWLRKGPVVFNPVILIYLSW